MNEWVILQISFRNVAEALVSKGLATVVRYRQDDDQRSSRYDDLLAAETKAVKSQLGLHSKKDYPPLRVTEIVWQFPEFISKFMTLFVPGCS